MPKVAVIAASSNGANEVVAAVTGQCVRVLAFVLSFSGSTNAKWQTGSTDKTGLFYGAAGAVVSGWPFPRSTAGYTPHFVGGSGEALNLSLSAGTAVGGYVVYDTVQPSQV